jgi:5-methyltetrahydrofolate--homocysteine methyltransferase
LRAAAPKPKPKAKPPGDAREKSRRPEVISRLTAAIGAGPVVLDAALGTRLCAMGLDLKTDDPALWNLTHPDAVKELHRRDVAAGAQAIVTNTFGANRAWLARFNRANEVAAINLRAVELARESAGKRVLVIGSVGPTVAEESGAAAEQALALARSGVDAVLLETFGADQIEPVLREVARAVKKLPLLVSLWDWPENPQALASRLLELGATVLGMNCRPGARAALDFAESLSAAVECPLLVKPSTGPTGAPGMIPSALARAVPRLCGLNVRLLGGCCGTTHSHVKALAAACAPLRKKARPSKPKGRR